MIIAIDGFSSTGKSTLARQLAAHFNFLYIDTGAMYRAVALFAVVNNYRKGEYVDKENLIKRLPEIDIKLQHKNGRENQVMLNGQNVTSDLRKMEVSNMVSEVAALPDVREKLVTIQRQLSKSKSVVMDGRDIGTVVFPNADIKFFINAEVTTRANRRWMEMQEKGDNTPFDAIVNNIMERDAKDSTREVAPLKKADDAIELNNTYLTREQQLDQAIKLVNNLSY